MPDPSATPKPPDQLPDFGPIYTETPRELTVGQSYPGHVAEPWNAATAILFVLIAVYWLARLRGRLIRHPFLAISLPLLLVGGIGGTLYHGLRNWVGFFLMDVLPIYLLGLIVSVYWWVRLGPRVRHLLAMVVVLSILQLLGQWQLPHQWAIQVSYAMLAMLILAPLVVIMIRTRFRYWQWVATSLACFGIAWFFRIADTWTPPLLPMGTHWLWHTFGAATTFTLAEYVYLIEGVNLRKGPGITVGGTQVA
jgi:hypothetical protein